MAFKGNPEHLAKLKEGAEVWNQWRWSIEQDPDIDPEDMGFSDVGPDLRGAILSGMSLSTVSLHGASLEKSDLSHSKLNNAALSQANLSFANLQSSFLFGADLSDSNLRGANLSGSSFSPFFLTKLTSDVFTKQPLSNRTHGRLIRADLSSAILEGVDLQGVDLSDANLEGANLTAAIFHNTNLMGACLKDAIGLDQCVHYGPSRVDHSMLSRSGMLPLSFLKGVGLPDNYIEYIPSLLGDNAIQYYSCFISHSTADAEFARRLYDSLQGEGVRCWYAPEEMKGGHKLHHQIDGAIRLHDKLVVILSEASMNSDWVQFEIMQTRKREKEEGRQMLFPISLVPFGEIQKWELFHPATVSDLSDEIRSYYIPDFSNWKQHDSYQKAFDRLLKDLRAESR